MSRKKKHAIKKRAGKKEQKMRLKKPKIRTISKKKSQPKEESLFQPFIKAYENFRNKQKVQSVTHVKFGTKTREKQIKE